MGFTKATGDYIDQSTLTEVGGGGVTWDSAPKTTDFTAAAGSGYLVDTSSSAITVTLPGSPSVGDEVTLVDYGANAATNNITITSSDDIEDSTNDVLINYNKGSVVLFYSGATKGWLVKSAANETATALGAYTPPALTVEYLVIGGGGAGGSLGGGGGAGGYRSSVSGETSGRNTSAESPLTLSTGTSYTVTVGAGGGTSNTSLTNGGAGNNSVFSTITSNGGGGGQSRSGGTTSSQNGGSGGGSTDWFGANTAGSGTTAQGFDGGVSTSSTNPGGGGGTGGGGGASAAGSDFTGSGTSGNGGDGLASSITGTSVTRAGGGGGGDGSSVSAFGGGSGGSGGGGNGGNTNAIGLPGTANTGGGGGGSGNYDPQSGAGGSGIVIIRYPSIYTISSVGAGLTTSSLNTSVGLDKKYTTFTAGTGNITFGAA